MVRFIKSKSYFWSQVCQLVPNEFYSMLGRTGHQLIQIVFLHRGNCMLFYFWRGENEKTAFCTLFFSQSKKAKPKRTFCQSLAHHLENTKYRTREFLFYLIMETKSLQKRKLCFYACYLVFRMLIFMWPPDPIHIWRHEIRNSLWKLRF